MSSQRKSRELCLQVLYSHEVGSNTFAEAVDGVILTGNFAEEFRGYGIKLAELVMEHRENLDALIGRHLQNWDFDRLAVVDRIVMRMALAEMMYLTDVPVKVALNEALDVVKKYSGKDSSRFVNGILDSAAGEISNLKTLEE